MARRSILPAALLAAVLAAPLAAQPMSDGEACLEGSRDADLDAALCSRALAGPDLAPPTAAALLTGRARALIRLSALAPARRDLDRAIALNPVSAQAHLLRGILQRRSAAMDGALADLDRALALNPHFVAAWAQRGALRQQSGRADRALADYDHALALRAGQSTALFMKATLRFQQGDFQAAADLFRGVLAQSPVQYPVAALWLAAAVRRQGGDGGGAIEPYRWWWADGVWPTPLVALLAGETNLPPAVTASEQTAAGERALGAFFIAQWLFAEGQPAAARRWL
ncbi:MAG: tetratricopeptide repeat protein, partial [Alphaproteobacteria bacterium]|nr:tetratricopeptide repeat protein [Alphaproteobacteria bacterium]